MAISYCLLTEDVIIYGPQFTRHWHITGGLTEETLKSRLQGVQEIPKGLCGSRHAVVILFICILSLLNVILHVICLVCTWICACVQECSNTYISLHVCNMVPEKVRKTCGSWFFFQPCCLLKLRSTDFQKSTFTLGSSHQIFFFSFTQQYKQLK